MLYASTKATLKQEFGSGQIQEEVHATTLVGVNYIIFFFLPAFIIEEVGVKIGN